MSLMLRHSELRSDTCRRNRSDRLRIDDLLTRVAGLHLMPLACQLGKCGPARTATLGATPRA